MFFIVLVMCCYGVVELRNATTVINVRTPNAFTSVSITSHINISSNISSNIDNRVNTSKVHQIQSTVLSVGSQKGVSLASHATNTVSHSRNPVQTTSSNKLLASHATNTVSHSRNPVQTANSNKLSTNMLPKTSVFLETVTIKGSVKHSSSSVKPSTSGPPIASSSSVGSPNQNCNPGDKSFCKNGGLCRNITDKSNNVVSAVCFCSSNFYGSHCESLVSEKTKNLYKQLTYAFGGTTAFLFIIITLMICCRCRNSTDKGLDYIKELDEFKIGNKRASAVITNPNVLEAFDIHSNGTADEKPSKEF